MTGYPMGIDSSVAIVLWSGLYGGAETWSVALAEALVRDGRRCGLVVVGPLGPVLDHAKKVSITTLSLGLKRGSEVLSRPRLLADTVASLSREAAILPSSGYLSAALRLGGFTGKIIAVEHGCLLQTARLPWMRRVVRQLDRWSGIWAVDALVAPSHFMKEQLLRQRHTKVVRHIPLGLDIGPFPAESEIDKHQRTTRDSAVIGFAGRLIPGKGLDVLLKALALVQGRLAIRLSVAGDGPERPRLEGMARDLRISDAVTFHGWVGGMSSFWRSCDLAVVPSHGWIESFGMVAVEAMACGLPVVASRQGGACRDHRGRPNGPPI